MAALFTTATTQKQPKSPWTEDWVKRMCPHRGMDLEGTVLRSKAEGATGRKMETRVTPRATQRVTQTPHPTTRTQCGLEWEPGAAAPQVTGPSGPSR